MQIRPSWRRRVALVTGGSALLTIVVGTATVVLGSTSDPSLDAMVPAQESAALRASITAHEIIPPKSPSLITLEKEHPIPRDKSGVLVDQKYPTLKTWLHPVAESEEPFPWFPPRHFGAKRHGIERRECGRGHCGVDLHGPRGTPILAVAAGVVVKVEHRASGGDGMSGRYVRLQHEDGSLTAYMHLDSIVRGLDVDDRVEAGQMLGTLGSTGVDPRTPHLHFALELPRRDNSKKNIQDTRFIDPAPWLIRARIAPKPEKKQPERKKRSVKPSF